MLEGFDEEELRFLLADYFASTAAIEDYEAVGVRHGEHDPFCLCPVCEAEFDTFWREHCIELPAIVVRQEE